MSVLVDTQITEQTIPPHAWHVLCQMYRKAHTTKTHKGWFIDEYNAYAEGLADGLQVDVNDLQEYVKDAVDNNRSYVGG